MLQSGLGTMQSKTRGGGVVAPKVLPNKRTHRGVRTHNDPQRTHTHFFDVTYKRIKPYIKAAWCLKMDIILAHGPKMKKIKTLYFLQLEKFEKRKCLYLFYFLPLAEICAFFDFWIEIWFGKPPKIASSWPMGWKKMLSSLHCFSFFCTGLLSPFFE